MGAQPNVGDFHVYREVRKRMWASLKRKLLASFAIIVALFLLSQMNSAKKAHDSPPARRDVVIPDPWPELQQAKDLSEIAAAAKAEAPKKPRFATVDELFQLLHDDAKAASRDAIEKSRDEEILKLSEQIKKFISAGGHEAQIASLVYARGMAAAQRTSDLAQFDAAAAAKKPKLRDAFVDLYAEHLKRSSKPAVKHDSTAAINALQSAFFDDKHPVHAVFDVFWYASLLVAVLGLVYLVLVPLYRLLPFGGLQEAMDKRTEDISKRSFSLPSAAKSIGIVSAVAISLAAIGGPIVHAAGNPFGDTFPSGMPGNADHQSKEHTKDPSANEDGKENGTKPAQGTDLASPSVTSTTPPTNTSGPVTTPPATPSGTACPTDCTVDIGSQIKTLQKNYEILINRQAPSLDAYATKVYVTKSIEDHADAERLQRDLDIQQAVLADVRRETKAIADAVTAHAVDEAAERKKLESRLSHIDTRTVSHALAADRPSVVERIVGIDRYVVTPAAVSAIEARYPIDDQHPENAAIRKVVVAMQSLGPISRTQIEWQIDGAVSGVAGNATSELRETIRRAKQLVVELSRRPA